MGRYLEIANQVISGVDNQPLAESDSKASSSTHCEKSELSERSPRMQVHVLRRRLLRESRDELRQAAGDYWDEFSVPAKIIGFADSLAIKQIRESNNVPDHYTAITECKRCGSVPIFPGCPPQIGSCPWCPNRVKGLPTPKTNPLRTTPNNAI